MLKMPSRLSRSTSRRWGKCIGRTGRVCSGSKPGTLFLEILWKWRVRISLSQQLLILNTGPSTDTCVQRSQCCKRWPISSCLPDGLRNVCERSRYHGLGFVLRLAFAPLCWGCMHRISDQNLPRLVRKWRGLKLCVTAALHKRCVALHCTILPLFL